MPELPEVDTIVRELREADLIGLKIDKACVYWNRSIAGQSGAEFCDKIVHQSIRDIQRRGKFLVFTLTGDLLLVHLRMTGKFLIGEAGSPVSSHERVRLHLSDKRVLRYEDQRKFGKWYLGDNAKIIEKIGVEPLSDQFSLSFFKTLLKGKHSRIKPFLLDQHKIAGIGNIYADEALWAAKIHPMRTLDTLTNKEIIELHKAIITVLQSGIAHIGTSLGAARANYFSVSGRRGSNQYNLKVFRHEGMPCSRCKTLIQKTTVAQRGTHFCPHCQT